MNLYDAEAVAAVWQRVRRDSDPLKETLRQLLSVLEELQGTYGALARCRGAAFGFCKSCSCSRRRLGALYDLLYGTLPEKTSYPSCSLRKNREQIRECFARELRCGEAFRELGEKYPAHRQLFCALARDAGCRAENLRKWTETRLPRGN